MKFKKKILFILLSVIFSLFIFSLSSSAFYSFCDNEDNTAVYTVPDLPTEYYVRENNSDLFSFITISNKDGKDCFLLYDLVYRGYNKPTVVTQRRSEGNVTNTDCQVYISDDNSLSGYNLYVYKSNFGDGTNEWTCTTYKKTLTGSYTLDIGNTDYSEGSKLVYSNKDIFFTVSVNDYTASEELFFQPPPHWGLKLGQPLQVLQILPMVNKLTRMILPIGLAIFSILLGVYLIASKKWLKM